MPARRALRVCLEQHGQGKEKRPAMANCCRRMLQFFIFHARRRHKVANSVIRRSPYRSPKRPSRLLHSLVMRVKILGSAAGGGFPQWNCACPNCRGVRAGDFHGKARSQAQIAISADGSSWFLLGASPDLRSQIEATAELHPREGVRQSPIAGAVLANADIDHVLGLLLLRELQPLRVHATESIRRILTEDNSMFGMLQRVPDQVTWTQLLTRARLFRCSTPPEKIQDCVAARSRWASTIPPTFRRSDDLNSWRVKHRWDLIVEFAFRKASCLHAGSSADR